MTEPLTLVFDLPSKVLVSSNHLGGSRHAIDADRRRIRAVALGVIGPTPAPAFAPVHALWVIQYPKGTTSKADPSNLQPSSKVCLDAAVRSGVLTDDAPAYVHAEQWTRGSNLTERGHHRLTLHLTPCDMPQDACCAALMPSRSDEQPSGALPDPTTHESASERHERTTP